MGAQHSSTVGKKVEPPRSYDKERYKPVKNGGHIRSHGKGEKTINNNYSKSRYSRSVRDSSEYDITYSSDNEVTTHREMTEILLEMCNGNEASGSTGPTNTSSSEVESKAISPIKMDVMCETESRLHFKIFDPNNERFEVRYEDMIKDYPVFDKKAHHTHYDIDYRESPFAVTVRRKATGRIIFDSKYGTFEFEDERVHITTAVHSRYLYGLGEHQKSFLIDTGTKDHSFAFWSRHEPLKEGHNLSGCHPFFLSLEEDGNAYGVFLLNSCPMEIRITRGSPAVLSYTAGGGILDFYVFTGPSPIEVIQQYQEVIGRPHLPPYWSLGFHLSRWGYETIAELNSTIERNRRTAIPYEAQWTDIDMMNDMQSWTFKDPELPTIVKNLHINGQKYIPIVDPGVSVASSSKPAYRDGASAGVFITNYSGTRPLVAKVWLDETVFPDFSHPGVYEYWLKQAQSLYKHIPFDGLWLDMNEPASFGSGCVENCQFTTKHPKDTPNFVPENLSGGFLYDRTVCPSARQYQGFHCELHNLYGHMQMLVSDRVCRALRGRRSLIISSSTFPGSGRHGGHWTGDNSSTFADLRLSISAMLDFNMFGIPLVGADIGGFFASCSEELMIRWMQVGAFYPFMRNHNTHPNSQGGVMPQDPASYSKEAQAIMADIVSVRYSLLPYLYTLLFENHTKGTPVVRPLFMLYPKDKRTYSIDEQFMWGSSLLFSPCLAEHQVEVNAYFPYDIWYDFFTGYRLTKVGADVQLPAPLRSTNIHIRGGSILVTQTPARNTCYSRNNPFGLLAALDSNHTARGKLYWDDGDVLDSVERKRYNLIKFTITKSCLTTSVEVSGYRESRMSLKLVQLFGIFVQPERVLVNGNLTPFTFTENERVLQLDKLDISLLSPLTIEW